MDIIQIGDIVTRKSYNHDVVFKVVSLASDGRASLKGLALRLEVNAHVSDLVKVNSHRVETLSETRERLIRARKHPGVALDTWWQTHNS